ncbi:MAG: tryptophan synthase subunit beta [Verrucomicrobiota bacterium]
MKNNYLLEAAECRYGAFGGRFMPELLMAPINELEQAFQANKRDPSFQSAFTALLKNYAGRPTALTEVARFSEAIKGPRIFLKREDLLHTGAHKLNNALGQCLLAQRMGKTRIIAETGAGQHGVATAAACAHLGLPCVIYMGSVDMERQAPNVMRMRFMGAEVVPVNNGTATLKDAVNEALRDWAETFADSHYCLGSALGPHPYPEMVAAFQSVIGKESREQCVETFSKNPDLVIACVGGGSNAIGIFSAFLNDPNVRLIGVEAGGHGSQLGEHAALFQAGTRGVLHGCYTYVLQDQHGQIASTSSISAGLDYPAVGPQHAQLFEELRVEYVVASDDEAGAALKMLARTEGILPALESAHALAYLIKIAPSLPKEQYVLVNLSGQGDKDLPQIMKTYEK